MLDSLATLYKQLGGLGTIITLLIIMLFIGSAYTNILTRRKYISLSEELAGLCAGQYNEFHSEILQWAAEEYRTAAQSGVQNINTVSIIDTGFHAYLKPCVLAESFIKKSNSLLITTGLFGTFIGLTYAVGNIGSILTNTGAEALMSESGADTLSVLVSSFQGMAVAFITSLFGTGFSILNMIFTSLFSANSAKQLFIAQLEEFLDIKIACEINEKKLKENDDSEKIKKSSDIIRDSMEHFDRVISDFSSNLKSIRNFNNELEANIEQIKSSFSFLGESMDRTSESVYSSGITILNCSETLKELTHEISSHHDSLENLSSALSQLQKSLEENKQDRDVFLKAVHQIPDKLLNYQEAAVARADKRGVSS